MPVFNFPKVSPQMPSFVLLCFVMLQCHALEHHIFFIVTISECYFSIQEFSFSLPQQQLISIHSHWTRWLTHFLFSSLSVQLFLGQSSPGIHPFPIEGLWIEFMRSRRKMTSVLLLTFTNLLYFLQVQIKAQITIVLSVFMAQSNTNHKHFCVMLQFP